MGFFPYLTSPCFLRQFCLRNGIYCYKELQFIQNIYCSSCLDKWLEFKDSDCNGAGTGELYTYDSKNNCDGWSGVDIDTCKQYCEDNILPAGCKLPTQHTCKYVVYYPNTKWCHLADVCTGRHRKGPSVYSRGNLLYAFRGELAKTTQK